MDGIKTAPNAGRRRRGRAGPGTRNRLLEVAFHCAVRSGWSRVRMGEVARQTGVSRQTLYRHFRTKEGLALALALREQEAFLEGCRRAFVARTDLQEAVRAAAAWTLKHAASHPLLRQAIEDPGSGVLPYITTRAQPLIRRGRDLLARLIADLDPTLDAEGVDLAADVVTRELFSHVVTPSEPVDVVASRLGVLARRVAGGGKELDP
jgi:AcrR family transcriptional regulator